MKNTVKKSVGKGREYVNILGINVISTSKSELLTDIEDFISHNKKFYIVTPNPELVLSSTQDQHLKKALQDSSFPVPDGTGLNYASKFLYGRSLNIIHGRNLFADLIEVAAEKDWKLFFLGGKGREAEIAANELRVKHPNLKIQTLAGPILNRDGEPIDAVNRREEIGVIEKINEFRPQLLFVAFGNPKQEIWIHKNLPKLHIACAMAVGGTLRYIAGMSKLPPKWMDKAGLEWVWRLITEPYRLRRVLNAFPIFPLRVFWFKVSGR